MDETIEWLDNDKKCSEKENKQIEAHTRGANNMVNLLGD